MDGRPLTYNEILLGQQIFSTSIHWPSVRVHAHGYVWVQPQNSGMTPNGEIYSKGTAASSNYALADPPLQAYFVHELAHVWQAQNGVLNPIWSAVGNSLRHGFAYSRAYSYLLETGKDLLDYRMEQQAQIIEDFFRVKVLGLLPRADYLQNKEHGAALSELYESVLGNFLKDPEYAKYK